MKDPIATRTLQCTVDGNPEQVLVKIGRPYEEGRDFRCDYEIIFPDRTRKHGIYGVDGVQALQLVMFVIGSVLSSIPGTSNWTWNGELGAGFPAKLDDAS